MGNWGGVLEEMVNSLFWKNKRVLITGHTGFKGSWMCRMLIDMGALVTGYALLPPTEPNLYQMLNLSDQMDSTFGDIRDLDNLKTVFERTQPQIVIHMAAQPLVRDSYIHPAYTYETNVMGTVNICECVRLSTCVKSLLNVTTDKVYRNNEWEWGYRENEQLGGFDPYSNSKSCSELVTQSYKNSFFASCNIAVSTVRSGNVFGGGDFAADRIVPDCVRAALEGETIMVRNPHSTRPYQHVLETLTTYLMITQKQYEDRNYAGYYNVGPNETDMLNTGDLTQLFCNTWGGNLKWETRTDDGPHEANFLKLDCSKIKAMFGWKPCWDVKKAMEKTVEWTKAWVAQEDISAVTSRQIREYLEDMNCV